MWQPASYVKMFDITYKVNSYKLNMLNLCREKKNPNQKTTKQLIYEGTYSHSGKYITVCGIDQ